MFINLLLTSIYPALMNPVHCARVGRGCNTMWLSSSENKQLKLLCETHNNLFTQNDYSINIVQFR